MFYNLESLLVPLHIIKMQVFLLLALLPYLDFDILKYFKELKEKDNATFLSHVTFCFSVWLRYSCQILGFGFCSFFFDS